MGEKTVKVFEIVLEIGHCLTENFLYLAPAIPYWSS